MSGARLRWDIVTLFPDYFNGPLSVSLLKRATERGIVEFYIHNLRDFTFDRHQVVDDYPYGGGTGMLLKPEPFFRAVDFIRSEWRKEGRSGRVILTTPQGRPFKQRLARELSRERALAVICGHYEGYDDRVRAVVDDEISIGDYVTMGGEVAALAIIEAVTRLLPGVLHEPSSVVEESHEMGILEYPQFTRPRGWMGLSVPEVLLSGHHERIRLWRRKEALRRTWRRRPDLLAAAPLTDEDRRLLREVEEEELPRIDPRGGWSHGYSPD